MEEQRLKKLIDRTKQKDTKAFSEVYEYYYRKLSGYVFRRVLNSDISQDIVSNTFFKVLDSIKKFKWVDMASFNGWIYRIAINEVHQYFRKQKKYKFVPEEEIEKFFTTQQRSEDIEFVEKELDQHESFMKLNKAIRKLKPKYQDIVHLRYFEELSLPEIASAMKMKEVTLRVYLHRALLVLKEVLLDEGLFESGLNI
jgi:RNA polymerase sigma-70 factor (ECF subfamily)